MPRTRRRYNTIQVAITTDGAAFKNDVPIFDWLNTCVGTQNDKLLQLKHPPPQYHYRQLDQ